MVITPLTVTDVEMLTTIVLVPGATIKREKLPAAPFHDVVSLL